MLINNWWNHILGKNYVWGPKVCRTYCLMLATSSKSNNLVSFLHSPNWLWRNQSFSPIKIWACMHVHGKREQLKTWMKLWIPNVLLNTVNPFRSVLSAPLSIDFWRLPSTHLLSITSLIISLLQDHQLLTLLLECRRIFSPLSVTKPFIPNQSEGNSQSGGGVMLGFAIIVESL